MPMLRRTAVTLATTGAATALLATPALACPLPHAITASGPTNVYDAAYSRVKTTVHVVTYKKKTVVTLSVSGLPKAAEGKSFGAHVHQKGCGPAPADAGPHYQNPGAPPGTPVHDKEIWLDFKAGPDGKGYTLTVARWLIAKGDAGSIIIHANPTNPDTGDAGPRLLCTSVPFGT